MKELRDGLDKSRTERVNGSRDLLAHGRLVSRTGRTDAGTGGVVGVVAILSARHPQLYGDGLWSSARALEPSGLT